MDASSTPRDVSSAPRGGATPWRAVLALFLVTVIWGGTFVWMKQGISAVDDQLGADRAAIGIALFNALRFGLAAITPAVSAFLTSLYVLFTAVLTATLKRRGPSLALFLGVVLATCGAGF